MVLMTHNTDISDSWEREAEDPNYFYQFSSTATPWQSTCCCIR